MGEKIAKEYEFFIYAVNCYALQVLWRFMLPKLFWVIRSLISGSPLRKSPVSLSINSSVSSILCITDNFTCFLTLLLQSLRSSWLTRKCKCHVNPFPIIQLCDILFSVRNGTVADRQKKRCPLHHYGVNESLQPKPCWNQLLLYLTVTSQVRYNKYYLKTSVHDYPKYISLCRHVEASKSLVCVELICTNNDKKSFTSEKTLL